MPRADVAHIPFEASILKDVVVETTSHSNVARSLLQALDRGAPSRDRVEILTRSVLDYDGDLECYTSTYSKWKNRFGVGLYEVPSGFFPDEWDDWGVMACTREHLGAAVRRTVAQNLDGLETQIIHDLARQIRNEYAHWGAYTMPDCLSVLVDRLRSGDNYGPCKDEVTAEALAIQDEFRLVMAWVFGKGLTSFEKWSDLLKDVKPVIIKCHDDDESYPSCCDWTGGSGD